MCRSERFNFKESTPIKVKPLKELSTKTISPISLSPQCRRISVTEKFMSGRNGGPELQKEITSRRGVNFSRPNSLVNFVVQADPSTKREHTDDNVPGSPCKILSVNFVFSGNLGLTNGGHIDNLKLSRRPTKNTGTITV